MVPVVQVFEAPKPKVETLVTQGRLPGRASGSIVSITAKQIEESVPRLDPFKIVVDGQIFALPDSDNEGDEKRSCKDLEESASADP
ncbi:hypothetical protein RJT34_20458 [Clitoria ternatea]|uniref:Uncharacterized protein n=1 Tax=Clitoria ternatea TaxID=43366 RepID=A0AAN9P500_CLITE